jgi:hypothetical protein
VVGHRLRCVYISRKNKDKAGFSFLRKMASPQFIPLKKGKECLAVQSWRESPSLKPTSPPPIPLGPSSTPALSQSPEDSRLRRKKGSKGGKGASSQQDDGGFDDFILKIAVNGVSPVDVEQFLAKEDAKPQRFMDIGVPRSLPLKRAEEPGKCEDGSGNGLFESAAHRSPSPPMDDATGDMPPEMVLPPSAPSKALETEHLLAALYGEQEAAEKAAKLLYKKWPHAATEICARRRSSLNASLVIKGLPFATNCERLVEELARLHHQPSYFRMHRSERGVFKCVVFVKFTTRAAAEYSKLELERLMVGTRSLKVEFKKKYRTDQDNGRFLQLAGLEQAVRDLRQSRDHEGFFYNKGCVSKEEVKYLKQLCVSYDLLFDASGDQVTVKRKIAADSSKRSPALRPSSTPSWSPATPGSLLPMDFKGIRHWKEVRQTTSLQIERPIGPGDVPPFGAGRGKRIS